LPKCISAIVTPENTSKILADYLLLIFTVLPSALSSA